MKGKQIVAIDVGSTNVVIAVGAVEDDGRVEILGIASEHVEGINAGRVDNSETAGIAVRIAKERLEAQLGIKITEAYVGLAGDYIRCVQVTDHVYVQDELGNGSNQITERDLEDLHRRMNSVKLPDDREEIVAKEPLRYHVDDREVSVPVGAYGHMLKATYNFILSDRTMRDRLRQCLQRQGIKVKEFVPNAYIAHLAVATTEDIEEGAIVINLGGGLTDVTVLKSGKVCYMASIPLGVDVINGDIRAYGIPHSYVENLKMTYGSAVHDLTIDDKIVFPHARKGTPKSIRRRNLARIIEERLVEICDWVRKEIKEAGCGSRFAPVVLLTGGGAEMQNIEELFARELKAIEVRSVYPEYGFTEDMAAHITTTAYATVASLLLYGAEHGSCAIAVAPRATEVERPQQTQHVRLVREPQHEQHTTPAAHTEQVTKIAEEPKRTEEPKRAAAEGGIKIEPATPEAVKPEEIKVDDGKQNGKIMGWLRRKIENLGNTFAGEDEEHDI